jgi:hypothetical protein
VDAGPCVFYVSGTVGAMRKSPRANRPYCATAGSLRNFRAGSDVTNRVIANHERGSDWNESFPKDRDD